ncbi:MAG TPA: hypothetical protein VGV59_19775 [Pyrinomonadaceae bacterium]|nr:hypothetical protein [Pyrinomonadaceae bacterium]
MKRRTATASIILKSFLTLSVLTLVLMTGNFEVGLTQSEKKEREIKTRTFHGMPLKVKEIRNLQKEEDWFRDLEIEVENISDKPIYFISLIIEFPDIEAPPPQVGPNGITPSRSITGFGIRFGSRRLIDVKNLATPDDIFLKPGETYVFKIPESRVQGLESMKRARNLPPQALNKIDIEFNTISFGDGTGYIAGQRRVYPKKKE